MNRLQLHIKELVKKHPFVDSIRIDFRPDHHFRNQVTCEYRDCFAINLINRRPETDFSLLDMVVAQSNEVLMRAVNHR